MVTKKRVCATSETPASPAAVKHVRTDGHGQKPSTGSAMLAISGSLNKVAEALLQPPGGPTESERKSKATKIILGIDNEKMSSDTKIQIARLFRSDVDFADQFLAMADDIDVAIQYILAELADLADTSK